MGEGEGGGDLGDYFTASGGMGGFEIYLYIITKRGENSDVR
jgi:hypothetical protein